MRKECFPPIIDSETRILILGTMPGEESLRKKEYYGHPQNQFWKLLGAIVGKDFASMNYTEKTKTLLQHNIGVWDVVATCTRIGSLDSDMKDKKLNAFDTMLESMPNLQVICFNGKTAQKHGEALIGKRKCAILASSSPAYTLSFDKKLATWKKTFEQVKK